MAKQQKTEGFKGDLGMSLPGSGETGTYQGDAEGVGLDSERPVGSAAPSGGAGQGGETGGKGLAAGDVDTGGTGSLGGDIGTSNQSAD